MSGPRAFDAVTALARSLPEPRAAALRRLRDPADGRPLDRALTLVFPGPGSFTGEDVAELHLHGSPAVVRGVLAALEAMPGLRGAEPGEFTRRALLNGRLDLSQVEGLGDLIAAETAAQHRQALRLMEGALSRLAGAWREALVRGLALVEASIDFADEDIPDQLAAEIVPILRPVASAMHAEARGSRAAERVRDGFEVALVGAPNVGKSTLLNALAGRDAALTSEAAGTTRDVIEVRMDLGGLPVTLLDMAGLREAGEQVEALGVARARERARQADLRVFLVEAPGDAAALDVRPEPGDLFVLPKADLLRPGPDLAVSGLTGQGVEDLLAALAAELGGRAAAAGNVTRERQRAAIASAAVALERAIVLLEERPDAPELVSAEIRSAVRALDFLLGKIDVEAVLDAIFQSFCIGK